MFFTLAIASIGWTASSNIFADTTHKKNEIIDGSVVCEYFMLQDFSHAIEEYKKNHNRSTLEGAFGLFMFATTWDIVALDEGATKTEIKQKLNLLEKEGLPQNHKDAVECSKEAGKALKSMSDAQAKRYFDASTEGFGGLSREFHFEIPADFFSQLRH